MNPLLQNLLILDIETVSATEDFLQLPQEMQKHWERKAQFLRNDEELGNDEFYFRRAGIYAEFGKIIVIAFGIYHEISPDQMGLRVKSFAYDNEALLLKEFKHFIETKFDDKALRLCAHNGKEFDFPYLSRRMLINGLQLPKLLDTGGKKPWEVNHLDTLEMWKFGDRKNFTSLDLLTSIFGIPSSKSDIDGSMVNEVYYKEKGLKRIEEYCRGDVIATAQLYLKMNSLPLIEQNNITIVR